MTLLAISSACSHPSEALRSNSVIVECRTTGVPTQTIELAVFDGHVSEFLGRRLRVVDGNLRWGTESWGRVQRGDKLEYTDNGWSVKGELREPLGIDMELTYKATTFRMALSERPTWTPVDSNRAGDLNWSFLDETLHVGDKSYAPIRPGDKVVVTEEDVRINGKLVSPLR
jgi:hypothetical protein